MELCIILEKFGFTIGKGVVDIYNKSLPFLFPVINRPTREKTSATITNHILTNSIIDTTLYSGIVKNDISDRFAIFCLLRTNFEQSNINNIIIKRGINGASIEHFKSLINSIDWSLLTQTSLPNGSYNIFWGKICTNLWFSISWKNNRNKTKECCQSLDYSGFTKILKKDTSTMYKKLFKKLKSTQKKFLLPKYI